MVEFAANRSLYASGSKGKAFLMALSRVDQLIENMKVFIHAKRIYVNIVL